MEQKIHYSNYPSTLSNCEPFNLLTLQPLNRFKDHLTDRDYNKNKFHYSRDITLFLIV
jgi:hypothetical protein